MHAHILTWCCFFSVSSLVYGWCPERTRIPRSLCGSAVQWCSEVSRCHKLPRLIVHYVITICLVLKAVSVCNTVTSFSHLWLVVSSVSSSMNSLAAVTWKDICESRVKTTSEFRKALFTKCLGKTNKNKRRWRMWYISSVQCRLRSTTLTVSAFGYGIIGVVLGFLMQVLRGHVMQVRATQNCLHVIYDVHV